ncbi:cell envelope biogenesis protein OmpA [Leptospira hartskeerlii]|uniref:Cell envelope biogenesis protein OmpA n=1 Tax=Leptospira hartskeerlii TaxID=2023177 RepID=A0A2M9XAV6_9LEPT|nr:OmpA family protein [Leptospira hartskeerlii]PJZ24672.1 cell envelope biogenesis protein OmpA [Leptospira hartskeerlii]PJZ33238.1 cell envelope biogenesis protein OmpA [Leptospira hartskeerlii]
MTKKQNYYVTIKGKKYDRGLIELAEKATSGKKDGRISIADAKKLLNAVKDNNTYTDIEKKTMEYVRENFQFTTKADEWFRTEIRKWAAEKSSHTHTKSSLQEEYTSHDEAISLMSSQHSDTPYRGYIPTPSAGQTKKQNSIPVLVLSLIILGGFGIGIYYAFRNNGKKPVSHTEEVKESRPIQVEEKKETSSSSSEKGSIFEFFSQKHEPANFSGKDGELVSKIQSSPILFDKNDIKIPQSQRRILDSLTFLLKKHSDVKAVLIGHASSEGTEEVNLKVSQLRAEMVRDYLLGNGLETSRFILEAKGSQIVSSPEGKGQSQEKNRRVDIQIVK